MTMTPIRIFRSRGVQRASMLLMTLALHARASAAQQPRLFQPEVAVQTDDYAQVRRDFRTKLLRQGASPQADPMPRAPSWVEVVEYPSGSLRFKAWMSGHQKPGGKLPAVLFLHGGFGFGADDWDMASPYYQAGYIVMVPLLRGENGQRGFFTFFYDEVDDVLAAADFLAHHPRVDSTRIFLAGHSAGGTLTLLATEASRRFRAASAFDGAPDQQLLYHGSASKPGVHQEIVFDTTDLREFQVRSPLAYAQSLKSPARLYFSTEARSIIELPTKRVVSVAKARGLDVAAVHVDGNHMSHVAPAMKQSIAFFRTRLGSRYANLAKRTIPAWEPSLTGNTTFVLRGYPKAKRVTLAGTFNSWDSRHVICGKVEQQWTCRIDLEPGKYLYKFVVDDDWILDPDNPLREDDGQGNINSIFVK